VWFIVGSWRGDGSARRTRRDLCSRRVGDGRRLRGRQSGRQSIVDPTRVALATGRRRSPCRVRVPLPSRSTRHAQCQRVGAGPADGASDSPVIKLDNACDSEIASQTELDRRSTTRHDGCGSVQRVPCSRWSRVVRCLLVIAAWQAPLPCWHRHGTLATATAESAAWLTEHLRTHHPEVDPLSPVFFGWHLHFSPLESGDDAPAAPKSTCRLVLMVSGLCSWNAFTRLQDQTPFHAWHDASLGARGSSPDRGRDAFGRAGGFYTGFAADMPLPVRLGMLRC